MMCLYVKERGRLGVSETDKKVNSNTVLRRGCSFYVFLLSSPQFVLFVNTPFLWVISGMIRGRLLIYDNPKMMNTKVWERLS